jgi:DnaK suppressor protein
MRKADKIDRHYQPRENEPYMNRRQLLYFRAQLWAWRRELQQKAAANLIQFKNDSVRPPEWIDKVNQDAENTMACSTQQRTLRLLRQIEAALQRIEQGEYGYCKETGEEIGIRRLMAYPIALLSVEAQERREWLERQRNPRSLDGGRRRYHLAA